LVRLAGVHASYLFDLDPSWLAACRAVACTVSDLTQYLEGLPAGVRGQPLYGYRECDAFVENWMAAELALRKLRSSKKWSSDVSAMAVGLANGGVELPSILAAVADRRGYQIDGALLRLSTYGARIDDARRVREGDAEYVRSLLEERSVFMPFFDDSEGSPELVILCDDNVTTAVSLQHARDVMLLRGHDVLGATVVRYPSGNRLVHMTLPGHGFPDPGALAGFIRGLVAPSPYTRLLVPDEEGTGNVYRNRSGRFNKAKERLEWLLGIRSQPTADTKGAEG
jgi:hypothetical protein